MTRRLVILMLFFVVATSSAPRAQGRTTISPSVSFGAAHDDNVFGAPKAQAESDWVWRMTPGLSITRETQKVNFFGEYSFDAERYQVHPVLDANLARQTASTLTRIVAGPASTVTIRGGYDTTNSPVQFNMLTGLVTRRFNAWRWYAGPEVQGNVGRQTQITARYDLDADYISPVTSTTPGLGRAASHLFSHIVDVKLGTEVAPRHIVHVRGLFRDFQFSDADQSRSIAGLLGWDYKATPFTTVTLEAGPRLSKGGVWKPEIDFEVQRRRADVDGFFTYTWTQASVIGLSDVLEVQRILGSISLHRPNVVDSTLTGGFYINELNDTRAYVYSVGADVTRRVAGPLSVSVGYNVGFQRGRIGVTPTLTPVAVPPVIGAPGLPPLLPIEPLRRSVLMFRVLFSPQLRPGEKPPEVERDPRRPRSVR